MPIKKNYTGEIIIILIFFCFFPLKFSNAGIPVEKIKLEGKAKVKVTKVPIRKNYPEGRIIGTAERLEYIEIKEKIKDSESPNEWILIETNTTMYMYPVCLCGSPLHIRGRSVP